MTKRGPYSSFAHLQFLCSIHGALNRDPDRLQPNQRLDWKLKNHKEWEAFNWKNWRLGGGEGVVTEQLSPNILRIIPVKCFMWFQWLSVFSEVITWSTDKLTRTQDFLSAGPCNIDSSWRQTTGARCRWFGLLGHLHLSGSTLIRLCSERQEY